MTQPADTAFIVFQQLMRQLLPFVATLPLLTSSCRDSEAITLGTNESSPAATVAIHVDPSTTRSIEGESMLDRGRYFAISDSGANFQTRVQSPERFDYLVNDLQISFGRELGPVKWLAKDRKLVREDPDRPGYADITQLRNEIIKRQRTSTPKMQEAFGENLDVAIHGNKNAFPEFMGRHQSDYLKNSPTKDHHSDQFIPLNTAAAAELSTAILKYGFDDFTRPRYYEPINEPHWSYLSDPGHIAKWHLDTLKLMHDEVPGVLVGGPCLSVGYLYSQDYHSFKSLKKFIDATACDMDFYSFHVYDFYQKQEDETMGGAFLSGLPLEGVLDLLPNYTSINFGRTPPLVISEHGGYLPERSQADLRSEAYSSESKLSFEEEMKLRSTHDAIQTNSTIANTLTFMEHPHTVKKAVPFMLLETSGWDPRYYAALYARKGFDPKSRELIPSGLHRFYELFRDVKGHRVSSHCDDPDIQLRTFVDGSSLFIIAHNLADKPEVLAIEAPNPSSTTVRRFGQNDDLTPFLSETSGSLDSIPLGGRETVVIIADYPEPIQSQRILDETMHYGTAVTVPVKDVTPLSISVPSSAEVQAVSLRIGFNRPATAGKAMEVRINGHPLAHPTEDSASRYTHEKHGYSSTRIIHFDPSLLNDSNTIEISFPDGKPGTIGSAVIRASRLQ